MIKTAVNIEITNQKTGAKAVYYPLKDEVLTGVLYSDKADITIIINGNEILLHTFKGVNSRKIAPDSKIFSIYAPLKEPVIIKAFSKGADPLAKSNIKVFFITRIKKEVNNE